jgi:two-component system phosphate regulon sensor histidine kinase PhoR
MKRSIFQKIFGSYFFLIIAVTLIILLVSYSAIRNFYLDTLAQGMEKLGQSLKLEAISYIAEEKIDELDAFVKNFGKIIDTRITIVDKEGKVLADSEEDPKTMDDHRFRPEILRAFGGNVGRSHRFSRTVKEKMLYVGLPIEMNGEINCVLRFSLFTKDMNRLLYSLSTRVLIIILVILALAVLASYFFARSVSTPLKELSEASHKIASGDFGVKIFFKNKDEFREVADSFNFMTEHIKTLFNELTLKQEQMNSILASIKEGLLTLDRENKILLSNKSFKEIAKAGTAEGKFYWEVIREPGFDELIKKVRKQQKGIDTEISLYGKIFLCSASFIGNREEILVTFSDVTHKRNIEKIKKDFVANVSHELRTPLTAIKGFVETLEEDVDSKSRNYLEIIKRHTDRLINIIKDLLVLSEMEEKDSKLEMERINVKDMIEQVLQIFLHKVKEKKLNVELSVQTESPVIPGDSFKLEQLFINLIDNAVKYTERGTISIKLDKTNGDLLVKIKDTGIGIPEEHLGRIFERFYVVDKSRSRILGGTGLGLSIVKHIALLHNGRVTVESTVGVGTTFSIFFPTSS